MLITLWTAGYIELDPKPRVASGKPKSKPSEVESEPQKTEGLFGELLDQMRPAEESEVAPDEANADPVGAALLFVKLGNVGAGEFEKRILADVDQFLPRHAAFADARPRT